MSEVLDILLLICIGAKAVEPIMLKVIAVIPITSLKMHSYRFINQPSGILPNGKVMTMAVGPMPLGRSTLMIGTRIDSAGLCPGNGLSLRHV